MLRDAGCYFVADFSSKTTWTASPLNMWPLGSPETSVNKY